VSEQLDYFGIRPECGCVTAWMAGDDATPEEIREFYRDMADTGRSIHRAPLTDEMRAKICRCPHLKAKP